MGPSQNAKIQSFFPAQWFPVLQENEALLENAYTPVAYRGNGIMSAAMALIAERAVDLGCRYVITFVERDNVPSLRGCRKSGFSPYLVRTENRFLLNLVKRRRFEEFREG
nr:GNAT family N-acetyltransferase [Falsiroseomonas tokyonensis]